MSEYLMQIQIIKNLSALNDEGFVSHVPFQKARDL